MSEGYVLVATGKQFYYDLAVTAALSIKKCDGSRRVCLLCDDLNKALNTDLFAYAFDDVRNIDAFIKDNTVVGTEIHLYLNLLTPYDRTMYVDADCVMFSNDIEMIWRGMYGKPVSFPGEKIDNGFWRVDIKTQMQRHDVDHVVRLNGGVFYFDKTILLTFDFFEKGRFFLKNIPEMVSVKHKKGGGYANEPIWGLLMALFKIEPFSLKYQLNVSTLKSSSHTFDDEEFTFTFSKGENTYKPVITHFIGLGKNHCPNSQYSKIDSYLRSGLTQYIN